MSGAAGFLPGISPGATPLRGADASRGRAAAPSKGTPDDASTFAAALVSALLTDAPLEVRKALGAQAQPSTRTAVDTEPHAGAGSTSSSVPSVGELLSRLEGAVDTDLAGAGSGRVDTRRLLAGLGPSPSLDVPDRDPAKLHPTLQSRLARVQERMASEFGHTVELAEGVRSGARQDHLFAQGRSRPGPVVTWTRSSEHEAGRAADVMIDGGWSDPVAFERLQRIAAEEGLVTLGARDPGHLELPGASGGLGHAHGHPAVGETAAPGAPDTRPVPRATGPARAARVAGTARVASVARPGVGSVTTMDGTPAPAPETQLSAPTPGSDAAGSGFAPPVPTAVERAAGTAAGPGSSAAADASAAPHAPVPSAPELEGTRPDFESLRRVIARATEGRSDTARSMVDAPTDAARTTVGAGTEATHRGAGASGDPARPEVAPRPQTPAQAPSAHATASPPRSTAAESSPPTSGPAGRYEASGPQMGEARPETEASRVRSGGTGSASSSQPAVAAPSQTAGGAGGNAAGDREGRRHDGEASTHRSVEATESGPRRDVFGSEAGRSFRTESPTPVGTADAARPTAAARAEQIADLQEQTVKLNGDRVNLRVEHPDGEVTRIRMGSADRRIDADLRTTNAAHAQRLRQDVSELAARLEENGLRLGDVAVRDARAVGRSEGPVQSGALESVLRQGLSGTSETGDSGAQGRDPQQRQQDQRQNQDAWSGRQRQPRDGWTAGDDPRHQTPWEHWKEDIR